jgi:hypothetical protein
MLLVVCLFVEVNGVVSSIDFDAERYSFTPFAKFAFKPNGKFIFEAKLSKEDTGVELLLLVIAKQDDCRTIGKSCVYEIPEIKNICASLSASKFQNKIFRAYPIITPIKNKGINKNITSLTVQTKSWLEYTFPNDTTLKHFITKVLAPLVHKIELSPYLVNSNSLANIKKVTTKIEGYANNDSYVYFSVLNCYEHSISLSIDYIFLNPNGEQLSSTDIPHKVRVIQNIR